jgi:hypothetical protein
VAKTCFMPRIGFGALDALGSGRCVRCALRWAFGETCGFACRPRSNCVRPVVEVAGGGERDRTDDLLLAKQALSQLSYTPLPGIGDQ